MVVDRAVATALADADVRVCARVADGAVADADAAAVLSVDGETVACAVALALADAAERAGAEGTAAERVCETTRPVAVSPCDEWERSSVPAPDALRGASPVAPALASAGCDCASPLDSSLPRRASVGRAASPWPCASNAFSPTAPAALTDFVGTTPASC
ncbi:hypothetical protein BURKHO8Y_140485 [Burkholderia sp. 8Y]|nr:hypothetical protein BURKHO8Y_140485 [Burkholderia sp. 8Y]